MNGLKERCRELFGAAALALPLLLVGVPASAQDMLIRGGTLVTITQGDMPNTDLLIRDGKIAQIGQNLSAPRGFTVIDATGRFVMPGILDDHSHMAIEGGINEGSRSVVPEVNISHVIRHDDTGIFTALAGGVTTINTMHGSANAIGGQNETFKLKWGRSWPEMVFTEAPQTLKFALGENVRQSSRSPATRYPRTRSGVAEVYREMFTKARDYQGSWVAYEAAKAKGQDPIPPRRDLQLEVMSKVMTGEIIVICHSYRADEIAMLMEVFNEFNVPAGTFTHVLEGYKVAPEMAANGWGASTFADSWAYKIEAYDAIPQKMAIMTGYGVRTAVNSDSGERIRRLYQEAARGVRYGGMSENDALKMITLNPATNLGVQNYVGSLETGKYGDVAIFSHYPLRAAAVCELTIIEGVVYFDRSKVETAAKTVAGFRPNTDGGGDPDGKER